MAENDSTTGSTTPEELANVQNKLEEMMLGADDKTKRQIFNQLICRLAEALPESPAEARTKEPAPISIQDRNLLEAADKLSEAVYLAEFIQSISLNVSRDGAILMQPGQVSGFYYAMQDTIDRVRAAQVLIDTAREQPEAIAT